MKTLLVLSISAGLMACGSSEESPPATQAEPTAATPIAAEPAAEQPTGAPVLEAADLSGLGSVQMPRGFTTSSAAPNNYAY